MGGNLWPGVSVKLSMIRGVTANDREAGRGMDDILGSGFTTFVVLGFALVFGLVVLAIVRSSQLERERQQRLAAWARHHEWTLTSRPKGEWPWTESLPGRHRRGVSLVMSGVFEEFPVTVAEYSYTTSSGTGPGNNTTTHWLLVVLVRLREPYPPVEVVQRGAVSRLARSLFGEGDMSTGDPEFDRRFAIKSGDLVAARALVGPALVRAHVADRVPTWRLDGDELMSHREGQLRDPDVDIAQLAGPLVEVARLLRR